MLKNRVGPDGLLACAEFLGSRREKRADDDPIPDRPFEEDLQSSGALQAKEILIGDIIDRIAMLLKVRKKQMIKIVVHIFRFARSRLHWPMPRNQPINERDSQFLH